MPVSEETPKERLERWRFDELIALDLAPDEALALIEIPDVVSAAKKLVQQGCPPELVYAILGD